MAANNRGNMRPAGRSPPFLAIGLFVALVILGFNYWNLSVKNGEQFNEISVMEREMKIVSAKKTALEKRAEAIQDKVKYLEDEINKQKGYVAEKASALATAQNERESVAQSKDELQTELDLMKEKVPLCQKEVADLKTELENKRTELESKKNELPQTATCGESECSSYASAARDKTLTEIIRAAGTNPLIQLYKAGGDLGKYSDQIKSYVESMQAPANQQPAIPQYPQNQQPALQPVLQPVQKDPVAVAVGPQPGNVEQPQQPEAKQPEVAPVVGGQPLQDYQPPAANNQQPSGDNQAANNVQPAEPQAAPLQGGEKPAEEVNKVDDQNLEEVDNKPDADAQIPKPNLDDNKPPALDDKLEEEKEADLDEEDADVDERGAGAGADPADKDEDYDADDDDADVDAAPADKEGDVLKRGPADQTKIKMDSLKKDNGVDEMKMRMENAEHF